MPTPNFSPQVDIARNDFELVLHNTGIDLANVDFKHVVGLGDSY